MSSRHSPAPNYSRVDIFPRSARRPHSLPDCHSNNNVISTVIFFTLRWKNICKSTTNNL